MKNEFVDNDGRVSLVELAVEMTKCVPFAVLFIALGYLVNTLFLLESIKREQVIGDRNFSNCLAIYLAEREGVEFEILSEKPGSYYATQKDGRPLE